LREFLALFGGETVYFAGVHTSACFTQALTAVSVSTKSFATWPIERSPALQRSTMSALKSG
jgi:hypothetical protein